MYSLNIEQSFPYLKNLDCFIKNNAASQNEITAFEHNNHRLISGFYYQNCPQAFIKHQAIALLYAANGTLDIKLPNQNLSLKGNQLLLTNSDFKISDGQASNFICFLFKKDYFISFIFDLVRQNQLILSLLNQQAYPEFYAFNFDEEPTIEILAFLLLRQIVKMDYHSNEITNSACALLLDELITNYDKIFLKSSDVIQGLSASNILKYCQTHLQACSLQQLAQYFHVHPNYISTLVKKETGQNLSSHLKTYRYHLAQQLLLNSTLSIENIANLLGYTDLSYFYKTFKQQTGLAPKQYRLQKSVNNIN